jgi:hypothetical protein
LHPPGATGPGRTRRLAAARTRPDLVIHLGDYHYREYCDNPALCAPSRDKGVVIGYDWAGWNADFFVPASPLLAAAPWVVVRGNHENCDRGGAGWMRFLSPLPYQACGNQSYKSASHSLLANNLHGRRLSHRPRQRLTLVVADNAGHEDYLPAASHPTGWRDLPNGRCRPCTRIAPTPPVWLLIHRPIWYDLLPPLTEPNALQAVLAGYAAGQRSVRLRRPRARLQTINFAPTADPGQLPDGTAGAGDRRRQRHPARSLRSAIAPYEGQGGAGSKERAQPDGLLYDGVAASSGILLNRYSFLLLERDDAGWAGTLLDPDGQPISRCRLHGERKEIACRFPSPLKSRAGRRVAASVRRAITPERQMLCRLVAIVGDRLHPVAFEMASRAVGASPDRRSSAPNAPRSATKPRASLCSPPAPGSNRRSPWRRQ